MDIIVVGKWDSLSSYVVLSNLSEVVHNVSKLGDSQGYDVFQSCSVGVVDLVDCVFALELQCDLSGASFVHVGWGFNVHCCLFINF